MDTVNQSKDAVSSKIEEIKAHMPFVYASIQRKAQEIGGVAYGLVRRGLSGERGCFYALEGGHIVGTPFFYDHPDQRIAAQALVEFGCAHVCIWPLELDGVQHGAH